MLLKTYLLLLSGHDLVVFFFFFYLIVLYLKVLSSTNNNIIKNFFNLSGVKTEINNLNISYLTIFVLQNT